MGTLEFADGLMLSFLYSFISHISCVGANWDNTDRFRHTDRIQHTMSNVIMGQHGIYQLQVVYVPILDTVCTKWYCGTVASQQHSASMHVFVFAPTVSQPLTPSKDMQVRLIGDSKLF